MAVCFVSMGNQHNFDEGAHVVLVRLLLPEDMCHGEMVSQASAKPIASMLFASVVLSTSQLCSVIVDHSICLVFF